MEINKCELKEHRLVQVLSYLTENNYKDKGYLIEELNETFKMGNQRAIEIYYYWKSKFMKTTKCIPANITVEIKPRIKRSDNLIIGKYGEYKRLDKCIVVGNHYFNNIEEVEGYRNSRKQSNLKSIDNMLDELVEIFELTNML